MSSAPTNMYAEVTQVAEMSVQAITSASPALMHMNTAPETVIISGRNRNSKAYALKQGRSTAARTLAPQFETIIDRTLPININIPASAALAETDPDVVFFSKGLLTVDERAEYGYKGYLKPKLRELGQQINNDIVDVFRTATWRFYGNPTSPLTTYKQLVSADTRMRLYGTTGQKGVGFIPMSFVDDIVQNGLGDFAPNRNNEDVKDWRIASDVRNVWESCAFMPQQNAGTVGKENVLLTVLSTTTDANGGVIEITFSGAPTSDPDAIKAGDKFQFMDNVAGFNNNRLVQFVGHGGVAAPVQNCVLNDAESDGDGHVSVQLVEPLQASTGQLQNMTQSIVAGMQVRFVGDHTVGVIMQGNPLLVGMAELTSLDPYSSASVKDPDTGISLRLTYGTNPWAENGPVFGWFYNALYGMALDADNAIAMLFPPIDSAITF